MSDDEKRVDKTGVETTGHTWDGIEELNNPLPRWWLWTFYATVLWGLIYTILYPAWPLVNQATAGLLGFSTRADVADEIATVVARNQGLNDKLEAIELSELPADTALHDYAVKMGAAVYANNCSQCHGAGAAGVQAAGYPNLLDDAWLWGGSVEDIAFTVAHGIRNEQSAEARYSEMPAFDDLLSDAEITAVVGHVLGLAESGEPGNDPEGARVYAENCASCHGDDGGGMREIGAPNLTDAIWLYGGDEASIEETVRHSRFGVMPAWAEEFRGAGGLGPAQIKAVAAYVHQLGGGE